LRTHHGRQKSRCYAARPFAVFFPGGQTLPRCLRGHGDDTRITGAVNVVNLLRRIRSVLDLASASRIGLPKAPHSASG